MKYKVLAYITRKNGVELLVFRHVHYPEAGVQVPAGTVEEGEALEAALRREIEEESGLVELQLKGLVATEKTYFEARDEWQERNFFHLWAPDDLPEGWTHIVSGGGEDEALHFAYSWLPISEAEQVLVNGQGRFLARIVG